jgi:DNA-binding transcriptional LysR family regulator
VQELLRQTASGACIDIRDLRCFAAASTCANFPLAARSLKIDASTVSRRIARLENALGVTLLERGRRGESPNGREMIIAITYLLAGLGTQAHERRSKLTDRAS